MKQFIVRLIDSEIPWFKEWHTVTTHNGKRIVRPRFGWNRNDAAVMDENEANDLVRYLNDERWYAEKLPADGRGRWLKDESVERYECSECGRYCCETALPDVCPHCNAKMTTY